MFFFFVWGESLGLLRWACRGLCYIFFFKFEGVPNFVIEGVPNTEEIKKNKKKYRIFFRSGCS